MNKDAIKNSLTHAKALVGRLEKIQALADSGDVEMHDEDINRMHLTISDIILATGQIGR